MAQAIAVDTRRIWQTNTHTHTHTHTHNLKRAPYIQYALTSNFVKLTKSLNVALQNVTEAFPDM